MVDPSIRSLRDALVGRSVVAVVGAGCSTASGIPDYRGAGTRARARNPMKFQEFCSTPAARRRYWARSMVGWARVAAARPNPAHQALADLEAEGNILGLISQNVDGLHQEAGSRRVVELHGALREVICMQCAAIHERARVQARLEAQNPGFSADASVFAPDGDADLAEASLVDFREVDCDRCGGTLKPHVVFFGERVPPEVTRSAWSLFDEAEALLVVGSSLTVFSGYRFVREAKKRGWPTVAVNRGPTRADPILDLKLDADVTEVLPALVRALEVVPLPERQPAGATGE